MQHSSHLLCLCYTSFCSKVKVLCCIIENCYRNEKWAIRNLRWSRGCCGFAVSPLPHRAGEKRKCFAANLQTICRGRCLSSSCGLCGIANHSICNAIACRACLSDHDERLFWRIFLTHNPPNISEQRTAVRHHYSLFIVIYFLSQSAKSRARCGNGTEPCFISFTHC